MQDSDERMMIPSVRCKRGRSLTDGEGGAEVEGDEVRNGKGGMIRGDEWAARSTYTRQRLMDLCGSWLGHL